MTFSRTPSLGPVRVRGFHAFHAREEQKLPVRAIVEGDLFRSARSSFFFFFLISSSSLTQNRALKLRFLQEKAMFQGGGREMGRGRGGRRRVEVAPGKKNFQKKMKKW